MARSLRFVIRFALLLAVLAALQIVSGRFPGDGSPYLSALSDVTGGAAIAAPGCNTKYCAKEPGRRTPTCHQSTSPYNCSAAGNVCTVTPC